MVVGIIKTIVLIDIKVIDSALSSIKIEGQRECAGGEALCDEARIRAVFAGTGGRLEKEHVVREARTRFRH